MPASAPPAQSVLTVVVNGRGMVTAAVTLAELITEQGFGDARVATAANGDFIPAAARSSTHLKNGDRIEIVSARQGG